VAKQRRVGEDGRIMIPADIRTLVGLTSGVRFVCTPVADGVLVRPAEAACPACHGTGKAAPSHE
jgi:AbrB family looped-hinge helix DNA binding protein